VTGIVFGEQPRWHDGRLWFSDWGTQEVIAVDLDGTTEVMHRGSSFPLCVDWLPDGRLLVVDTSTARLLVHEADGTLDTYADLRQGSDPPAGNEPNPDRRRVLRQGLTAYEIADDGTLTNGRVWAELGDGVPDGICIDVEGAVWYADVPNKRCARVNEGGELLDTVELDRGGFACALGGPDRQTLYILATEWNGPENMFRGERTGQLLTVTAPAAAAGWPGR
jgi:sugar lactone lactonase YvrE